MTIFLNNNLYKTIKAYKNIENHNFKGDFKALEKSIDKWLRINFSPKNSNSNLPLFDYNIKLDDFLQEDLVEYNKATLQVNISEDLKYRYSNESFGINNFNNKIYSWFFLQRKKQFPNWKKYFKKLWKKKYITRLQQQRKKYYDKIIRKELLNWKYKKEIINLIIKKFLFKISYYLIYKSLEKETVLISLFANKTNNFLKFFNFIIELDVCEFLEENPNKYNIFVLNKKKTISNKKNFIFYIIQQ